MKPFAPTGDTVNIAVSASSQRVAIGSCDQVRVMNNGSATVWCMIGDGTVTVTATDGFPVGPGVTEVLSVPNSLIGDAPNVAVIAAGATGSIYFTPGTGI